MTINVYFIEGHRGSICNNDAYSVVEGNRLIDIIPASEFQRKGLTVSKVVKAFEFAAKKTTTERQKNYARKVLGL
ncbi:MAG: hypothetical protein K8R48_03115 [Alphaproteobacteria bacterium]|nr:hypothetical protein [Alphaproteobacteria bacterium]